MTYFVIGTIAALAVLVFACARETFVSGPRRRREFEKGNAALKAQGLPRDSGLFFP